MNNFDVGPCYAVAFFAYLTSDELCRSYAAPQGGDVTLLLRYLPGDRAFRNNLLRLHTCYVPWHNITQHSNVAASMRPFFSGNPLHRRGSRMRGTNPLGCTPSRCLVVT